MLKSTSSLSLLIAERERRKRKATTETAAIKWLPDPAEWIETNFYAPETRGPIHLSDYQRRCLREALRRDESGNYVYSTIVWADIKKSIKSTMAAGVGLWVAYGGDWRSVKVIANDLKQADSRVSFYMRRAIELNPAMKDTVRIKPSGYFIELPNRSRIESVPIDPKGEAGGNDDAVIYSELWGAKGDAATRMWTETTLSPTKFGQSFRWVETYAGYDGEAPILEQLYRSGVKNGRQLWNDLPVFVNEAARLFVLWNETPRLPWQTPEYYAQEAATLTENEFLRVHRNQWVSSESAFVPKEWWAACQKEFGPTGPDEPIVLAADAAVSNDCFGLVGVSRNDDRVRKVYARKWSPPKGGTINFADPEAEIRRLHEEGNVLEVAYDAYQLHDMMTRLKKDGINTKSFSQGQDRLVADKQLYDLIRDRRIEQDGDLDLAEHIGNANAKLEGDKLRIVKRADHLKIDLAVALSMASARILKLNL